MSDRNLPAGLRLNTPTTPRAAAPAEASTAAAPAPSPAEPPTFVIHVAADDINILRHLQNQGRITVWSDHRSPAKVELRVRLVKDHTKPDALKIEALLDEVAPGWTYIEKTEEPT